MDPLLEWFRENGWIGWGVGAIALAAAELLTLDLTLLMLAAGALAAGIVWFIVPSLIWVQVIVGLFTALLMLAFLRPTLLHKVRDAPGYRSSVDQLLGSAGVVTGAITSTGGEVRVDGQLWEARSYLGDAIEQGESVEVMGVDGITLLVHPAAPNQISPRNQ